MARIFKNKTALEVSIQCGSHTQIIPGNDQFDLSDAFTPAELAACDYLIELLGQGIDKYQLNDGTVDLSVAKAIDLIRGYYPSTVMVTTPITTSEGTALFALDAPREVDKRNVFVLSPGLEGSYTWITSRGDDPNPTPPASGRGDGSLSLLDFSGPDTKEVELNFSEAMQLLGGCVYWKPATSWDFEDSWNLLIRLPATTTTPNVSNTGNCNVVPTGLGFNIIVPAAGDGAYDVDLATAIPVPDGYSSSTRTGSGYWDVDRFWSEAMTPNVEAHGEFNLYDLALEFYFCKNVSCGNPNGDWKLDPYKAEWVSSRWVTIFKATKVTAGAGKIGGFFHVYRPGAM